MSKPDEDDDEPTETNGCHTVYFSDGPQMSFFEYLMRLKFQDTEEDA